MTDVGKVEFNANQESATKSTPPKGWPQPKTKEKLVKNIDSFHNFKVEYMNEELMAEMDYEKMLKGYQDAVFLRKGGHPRFNKLLEELSELHVRKDHDYSESKPLSNFNECKSFGIPNWKGALVRMGDKWARIKSIIKKGDNQVKDESLIDSLKDLGIYSIITIILLEECVLLEELEEREKELQNDTQVKEKAC